MQVLQAKLAYKIDSELGESALWDERFACLWWVDILKGQLHRFDPAKGENESFDLGVLVGAVAPEEGGELVLAVKNGFARYDTRLRQLEMIASMEHALPGTRFNEGRCDPGGRFWAGTIAQGAQAGAANLFCLERDLSVSRKIKGVSISNGLGWNRQADRMYYIDSPSQRILEFNYDNSSGAIHSPRVAVEVPVLEGAPDGMCVDAEGMLWVAIWGAGKVARFNPASGERLLEVKTEGAKLSSCCSLGGPDMSTLFITTARENLSVEALREQPLAGSLFSADVAVKGMTANSFKRL
jgi:sugar lactone lactonase YvrE